MKLISTETFHISEHSDNQTPKYAILSHRWESNEASFTDFRKDAEQNFQKTATQSHQGFVKIRRCCDLALTHGFRWVWIDTCCINKESSSELTEAINSMYDWYRKAETCYVYLADVGWKADTAEMQQASMSRFRQSSWFTRGWTLQELLAPAKVHFYDQDWRFIGTKDELAQEVSGITQIDIQFLLPDRQDDLEKPCTSALDCRGHSAPVKYWSGGRKEPSIATRMSWASRRHTSRIEDMAYCLLGIFNVNMPLLYGERQKAFTRLQREIIKNSNDDSIFAWATDSYGTGVLARWPSDFAQSRYVYEQAPIITHRRPYSMTNQGLSLPMTYGTWDPKTEILDVVLDCGVCGTQGFRNIVLRLKRSGKVWNRVWSHQIVTVDEGSWSCPPGLSRGLLVQEQKIRDAIVASSVVKTVGTEMMVQATWSVGYGPAHPLRGPLLSKL
ncbi:MAG: hypothetical protein Q9188_001912 [Gyalolechia gomerana]